MRRITLFLLAFSLFVLPITVYAIPLIHPAPNSMGEPSIEKPFGYYFADIRGDYRQSLGQTESTIQTRYAYLSYFENRVTGATTGSTHTSSFVILPTDETDWEVIKNRTGQAMYYVGKHDENNMIVQHLERAIDNYAQFYNGNAQFIKDIILSEVRNRTDYYDFRTQPIYQYGSPYFSIQDMFMLTGDDLFFRIPYISRFSGAGNAVLIENNMIDFDPFNLPEDTFEYFSKAGQIWEQTSTHWPSIEEFRVLENGDVQYTVKIHAVYDNKGHVDLIGNFEQSKVFLPNNEQLASLDLYWRKHAHEYFRNLVDSEGTMYKEYVYEQEIPISANVTQTFTHTVPKDEVERILADNGNMLTLYVTDNYGRYAYKEIEYKVKDTGCLVFSRALDDHRFQGFIPQGVRGIGSKVQWRLTYNKNLCAMDEVVSTDHEINPGHIPDKNIYSKTIATWDFWIRPVQGGGVEIENTSKSESRPLVVQLKYGDSVIETFTLAKGAKKKVNVPNSFDYYFYFPTPSEQMGFWDDKENIMRTRKASKEFPSYIMPHVEEMLAKYGLPE